jgi:hypothetical protein
MHPNLSAGFAGAGNALQQGVQIYAQRQLEEMKDMRAENLARMSFGWKAQHDVNVQQCQFEHDDRQDVARAQLQRDIAKSAQELEDQRNEGWTNRATAAAKYQADREDSRQQQALELQRNALISKNRDELRRVAAEHDANTARLNQELDRAVAGNLQLSMISDPVKKQAAMASDPVTGAILQQLHEANAARARDIAAYTLYGASLKDPMFQGKQNPPGVPLGTPAGPSDAARYNGDIPGASAIDSDPNSPDNTGAAVPPANSPPGASAAGMPPTVGPQRAPITTMVGPLRAPPQLIPADSQLQQATAPTLIPQTPLVPAYQQLLHAPVAPTASDFMTPPLDPRASDLAYGSGSPPPPTYQQLLHTPSVPQGPSFMTPPVDPRAAALASGY